MWCRSQRMRKVHDQDFCSALQFKTRYELSKREMDYVLDHTKEMDVLSSVEPPSQNTTIFHAEVKDFHYVRAPVFYQSDQSVKRLHYMSVVNCRLDFGRKGLPDPEVFQRADTNRLMMIRNELSNFTNIVSNIHLLSPDEIVQDDEHSELGGKPRIRPKQKNLALMKTFEEQVFEARTSGLDPL